MMDDLKNNDISNVNNNGRPSSEEKKASTQGSEIRSDCVLDYTTQFTTKQVFNGKEELLNWVRDVGRANGFVVIIKTSDYGGGRKRPRIYLACERSGQYRSRNKREDGSNAVVRQTGTKKCGCPFDLRAHKLKTNDEWTLHVVCGLHNHPAADHLEGHSYAGRLSSEEKLLLVDMSKSMVRPKEILTTIKQRDVLNASTMKTIYNVRHRCRLVEKAGRSQMQQLLGELAKYKYIERHRCEESTMTVTDLFWAHPVSLDLLRTFPRVLIMDCTYKTNRYRLPLLEIVGVTSTDMTFSVAFAYMQFERADNYEWVLNTLRGLMEDSTLPAVIVTDRELALVNSINKTFPNARHLLCRWHISKNVLTKCKKMFETKERWEKFNTAWNYLVYSSTEEEYNDHLATLLKEFSSYPDAVNYVSTSWLHPYKEKFVAAWTDTCMHFGNVTTNRAESAHSKLKRQLGSSQATFEASFEKIHSLLELQHTNIKASFEKSLTVVQHQFKPAHFRQLRGNVSIAALEYVLGESKRANFIGIDVLACGCVVRRTHGLPCAHEIADYMRQGCPIPLDSIHIHWRRLDISVQNPVDDKLVLTCIPEVELIIKRFNECSSTMQLDLLKKLREIANPETTFLIEPEVKPNPRKRGHTKVDVSTRRDPCAFELIESGHDSHSPRGTQVTLPHVESKKKRISKQKDEKQNVTLKTYRTRAVKPTAYIDALPAMLRPYIRFTLDVQGDGNCGFRAIAGLLGRTEDDWVQVRRDLLRELHTHQDEYTSLYGSEQRVQELTHMLSYFEDSPGYDRWMTMPDMGHLIASFYDVVLYHISMQQCLTFLPLRSIPVTPCNRREIAIGFVNGNHFVQVMLVPGHPIPLIATNWRIHHHPCAAEWENAYVSRIQHFKDMVDDSVATRETFDIVDID